MSLIEDGRRIHCDGAGCDAITCRPVSLHPVPNSREARMVEGWLFVTVAGRERHYCPRCAPDQLRALSLPAGQAGKEKVP